MTSQRIPLYAISDLHFFSEMGFSPHHFRGLVADPFPVPLLRQWRKTIERKAWLLIPGDLSDSVDEFCVNADLGVLDCLPGRKLVSPGNHDRAPWDNPWERAAFFGRFSSLIPLHGGAHRLAFNSGSPGLIVAGARGAPTSTDASYDGEVFRSGDEESGVGFRHEFGALDQALAKARKLRADPRDRLAIQVHHPPFHVSRRPNEITELVESSGADLCVYGHLHADPESGSPSAGQLRPDGTNFRLVSADALEGEPLRIGSLTREGVEWSF